MKNSADQPPASQSRPIHQQSTTCPASAVINHQRAKRLLPLLPILALCLTGCQVLTYRSPSGERFSRSSIGANTAITSLTVDADTNGVRSVKMQGYQNDASQALGAVTQAAVSAAVQAATKP